MTINEAKTLIENLKLVNDSVRILDINILKSLSISNDNQLVEDDEHCFVMWNNNRRCENCVSQKSCRSGRKQEKYEFINGEVYYVLSVPIEIEGKKYALEVISHVLNNVLIDSHGNSGFEEYIENINNSLYKDSLTLTYNRRYFDDHFFDLFKEKAVVIFDVDSFKSINKVYGRSVGDCVLREVSAVLNKNISIADSVVRFGGDDFLCIIHSIDKSAFIELINKIRKDIISIRFPEALDLNISVSAAAVYNEDTIAADFDDLTKFFFVDEGIKKKEDISNQLKEIYVRGDKVKITDIYDNRLSDDNSLDLLVQGEVIRNFVSEYDLIFSVNLDRDKLILYYSNGENKNWIVKNTSERDFEDFRKAFIEKFIYPEDESWFKKATSKEAIRKQLSKQNYFILNCRLRKNGITVYYEIKFVKDANHRRGNVVLIGGRSVDVEKRESFQYADEEGRSYKALEEQLQSLIKERTKEIEERTTALNRINEDIIEMLGDLTEARDVESGNHVLRVKGYTYILANQVMKDWPEYGLTDQTVSLMASASALHDIGKITIPDSILLKPGKLTAQEFEIMKTHSEKGTEILKKAPRDWSEEYLQMSIQICNYHHEKYDGKGYPNGLKGDDIPIAAQIVSVADCFDALTTERTYKNAYDAEVAFAMIKNGDCGVFSEKLMSSFEKCKAKFIEHIEQSIVNLPKSNMQLTDESLIDVRILYVDDNEINLEMCKDILENEGVKVVTSTSGKEAIDIFYNDQEFDAIILDVLMPEMDGPQTAKELRKLDIPYSSTIPIIALTASEENEDIERCLDAGMDAYLVKPISVSAITRTLLKCIKNKSEKIKKHKDNIKKMSKNDIFTSVKNISVYTDMVGKISKEIESNPDLKFALVSCNINGLANVNDKYGHFVGNLYIMNATKLICEGFKRSPVYRIGSDDFIIILMNSDYENRSELLNNLRKASLNADMIEEIEDGKTSFAIGMSEYDKEMDTSIGSVINRAQIAMKSDKQLMKFRGKY